MELCEEVVVEEFIRSFVELYKRIKIVSKFGSAAVTFTST